MDIDLGHGHTLRFMGWRPDRDLNPQYDGVPDVDRFAAIIEHPHATTGQPCVGQVTFAGQVQDRVSPRVPKWTVESWEPLTLSPSVLCSCGDHGYVRDGRWIAA